MAGGMLSAVLAKYWVRRLPWPTATRSALAGLITANALSLHFHGLWLFLALQCAAGFFGGSLYSLTLIILSDTEHPDRNFGFAVAAQVVFQVAGLLAGPALLHAGGINALLLGFVVVGVAGLMLAQFLPEKGRPVPGTTGFKSLLRVPALLALGGCFFFLFNAGCYWTYVEVIAQHAGVGNEQIAIGLAVGASAGLLGALLASWCGTRVHRNWALAVGTILIVVAVLLLRGKFDATVFTASALLYNFAWNYSLPYQYGAVNAADATGHGVALAPAFHTAGGAAGPAIAAFVLTPHSYSIVIVLMSTSVTLSLAAFVGSSAARRA
jgi:predicted MFS family arabinose efflux permease